MLRRAAEAEMASGQGSGGGQPARVVLVSKLLSTRFVWHHDDSFKNTDFRKMKDIPDNKVTSGTTSLR